MVILKLLENDSGSLQVRVPDSSVGGVAIAPAARLDKHRLLLYHPLDGLNLLQQLGPADRTPISCLEFRGTGDCGCNFPKDNSHVTSICRDSLSPKSLRRITEISNEILMLDKGTSKSLHLGAQGSLCRLLHGFAVLTRQVLAKLLLQMVLLNEAPANIMRTQQQPSGPLKHKKLWTPRHLTSSAGLVVESDRGRIRPRAHLNSSGE